MNRLFQTNSIASGAKKSRPAARSLVCLFLAAAISGCASFTDVRKFASLSGDAASFDGITRGYAEAPERRKQYQPPKFHPELESMKARREAQRAGLDLLQQTLADYMHGLDALASGNIRAFDKSLADVSTSLNKTSVLDANEKQAVGALSTLLARSATALYREQEMKKLIGESNGPLQDVIRATRRIVKNGILADLEVESALIARYYDNIMLAPDNPPEPVAMALAREARAEALSQAARRLKGAEAYDNVLSRIAAGHQYLYDHRSAIGVIGSGERGLQLKPHIDALRSAYKTLIDVSRDVSL
jgi:hypothetical protein